jgi:hypothetical protein
LAAAGVTDHVNLGPVIGLYCTIHSWQVDLLSPPRPEPAGRNPACQLFGSRPPLWLFSGRPLPENLPAVSSRTAPPAGERVRPGRGAKRRRGRSGKDQVPADLPRTTREPGGEAQGRRPQPCRSKAEARSWRGGPWSRLGPRWAKQARPGSDQVARAAALKTRLPHPRREGQHKQAGRFPPNL